MKTKLNAIVTFLLFLLVTGCNFDTVPTDYVRVPLEYGSYSSKMRYFHYDTEPFPPVPEPVNYKHQPDFYEIQYPKFILEKVETNHPSLQEQTIFKMRVVADYKINWHDDSGDYQSMIFSNFYKRDFVVFDIRLIKSEVSGTTEIKTYQILYREGLDDIDLITNPVSRVYTPCYMKKCELVLTSTKEAKCYFINSSRVKTTFAKPFEANLSLS